MSPKGNFTLTVDLQTQQSAFVTSVTTQVIERHLVRGLDKIFSPLDVNQLSDDDVVKVVSEPAAIHRKRQNLDDKKGKLLRGREIFRDAMCRVR
jgi:hypothetical protein